MRRRAFYVIKNRYAASEHPRRRWELVHKGDSINYSLPAMPCDMHTLYHGNKHVAAITDKVLPFWVIITNPEFCAGLPNTIPLPGLTFEQAKDRCEMLVIGCDRCNVLASLLNTHHCEDCGRLI